MHPKEIGKEMEKGERMEEEMGTGDGGGRVWGEGGLPCGVYFRGGGAPYGDVSPVTHLVLHESLQFLS